MTGQPKMRSRLTNISKFERRHISTRYVSRLSKPTQSDSVYSTVLRATFNSPSISAPSHDTAAAIVPRCTTGEQRSCMFYTAGPVWSFLQRGTDMRRDERMRAEESVMEATTKRNTQQPGTGKAAHEPKWPSGYINRFLSPQGVMAQVYQAGAACKANNYNSFIINSYLSQNSF